MSRSKNTATHRPGCLWPSPLEKGGAGARCSAALILLVVASLAGCRQPEDSAPALEPVPRPSLENLDGVARARIDERRSAFDGAVRSIRDSRRLAAEYGELGRTYFAFAFRDAALACFTNASRLAPDEFRWRYFLGALLKERGELNAAAVELEQALELHPGDLPAGLHLARVELDRGRLEAARALYRRLLAEDPELAAAHYGLGMIALAEKDPVAAIAHLERAASLDAKASAAHHALGTAYRRTGDLEKARHHLGLGGAERPRFADPLLDDLASLATGARVHLDQGMRAQQAGDLERAAAHFEKAAELDPENATARHNLGSVLGGLGRHAEALPHIERAIELDPKRRDTHFDRATALTRLGRLDEAAAAFERVLAIDPGDRLARYRLALVLSSLGETRRAGEELSALVAADPGDLEARLRLASLWREAGRTAEAEGHYAGILALSPGNPQAATGYALLLIGQERYAEARQALESGLELGSADPARVHLLARLLATCPRPEVRDGARALELAQTVFDGVRTLEHAATVAMAFAELGRFAEAARWQRSLVEQAEAAELDAPKLAILTANLERYQRGEAVRVAGVEP